MSVASRSAMRPCVSGGTGLVQCSPLTSAAKRVEAMRAHRHWQWHLDEVYVKINGVTHYLWRAVDHDGEVLESFVTKSRDRKAALKFLRKSMKRHGRPEIIVTDRLRSYGAALKDLGCGDDREMGGWLNNRAENSHLPFRRRERAMLRFRRLRTLQKFASVHASVHNPRVRQQIEISGWVCLAWLRHFNGLGCARSWSCERCVVARKACNTY